MEIDSSGNRKTRELGRWKDCDVPQLNDECWLGPICLCVDCDAALVAIL